MGVKGLWTLLAPFCERKPLYEIGGETVAVDLSGWICDSQNVTENHSQPKLYLRNLYFRTSYLLLYDVIPVFVLEGQAPEIKRKVMEARRQLQYNGTKQGKSSDISRRRFKSVLTHCEKLLSCMGLKCVAGAGEAEAMCAHLNGTGLVTGVISQDSDCFVYGAKRLYRNFSVAAGCGGSVDVYDLKRIQQSMDLGRNKMVALALLCGSDYNGTGVDGVGFTSAISFLQQFSEVDIIPRLVSWNTDIREYKTWERRVEDSTNCTNCGHGGILRTHTRQGCPTCATHKGCNAGTYKQWRLNMKLELQIRSKALSGDKAFPDPELLNEFLSPKETTPPYFNPSWSKPDLIKFTKLMTNSLGWSECYCLEKFLPLMTRWQLLHPEDNTLHPKTIIKKRNPRGVACYQVLWIDPQGLYDGLVTDDQITEDEINIEDLWTTVERQDLMKNSYPQIVEEFEASKMKKKDKPKSKKKKQTVVEDEEETGLENVVKQKRGKKRKAAVDVSFKTKSTSTKKKISEINNKKKNGGQKTLNSFIKKANCNPVLLKKSYLFDEEANSTAELMKNLSLDLCDDFNETDLSNIVEDIVARGNTFDVNDILNANSNNFSTPNTSFKLNNEKTKRVSYFFGEINEDFDAFERSMDLKNVPDESDDSLKSKSRKNVKKNKENINSDAVIEKSKKVLSLEERLFGQEAFEDVVCSTPDKCNVEGSFHSVSYTPLAERIKRLKDNL